MRPKKRVLFAGDNSDAVSMLLFMLTTRGFYVIHEASSADAIRAFSGTEIDVVVSTLELDELDGNQLIARLKAIRAFIPMILISSSVRPGERAHGADCFIGKNYLSPTVLYERISAMAKRKRGPRKVQPAINQELVDAG